MRMKIKALKNANDKYIMVADMLYGPRAREYPQECREHDTAESVYADAYQMYSGHAWRYNAVAHTISC